MEKDTKEYEIGYKQGREARDKEIAEGSVFFSNRPIEDIMLETYNQALDDLWKLVTSRFDEVMDFQDLCGCIKELKK